MSEKRKKTMLEKGARRRVKLIGSCLLRQGNSKRDLMVKNAYEE